MGRTSHEDKGRKEAVQLSDYESVLVSDSFCGRTIDNQKQGGEGKVEQNKLRRRGGQMRQGGGARCGGAQAMDQG